jgi:hypothetical protein
MDSITLILVARGVHVLAGVVWAGFVLFGILLVPIVATRDDAAARALRQAIGAVAPRIGGPAALLTILSGIYLMAVLHPGDESMTGFALRVGALTALSSVVIGAALIGPRARKLAKVEAGTLALDPLKLQRLRAGLLLGARLNGVAMLITVLAMATARYL